MIRGFIEAAYTQFITLKEIPTIKTSLKKKQITINVNDDGIYLQLAEFNQKILSKYL